MSEAPVHLVELEFRLPEETFLQNVEVAEKTLEHQREQLKNKANIKDILRKHQVTLNRLKGKHTLVDRECESIIIITLRELCVKGIIDV